MPPLLLTVREEGEDSGVVESILRDRRRTEEVGARALAMEVGEAALTAAAAAADKVAAFSRSRRARAAARISTRGAPIVIKTPCGKRKWGRGGKV